MLEHELLADSRILIVRPSGPLQESDFKALAADVDPFIKSHGDLAGLMIDAPQFPGWEDFAGLIAHLRFVRDHHRHIQRVAAVTDSGFLSIMPSVAGHFVSAQVRAFAADEMDKALAWLKGSA